jgi:hypothetical protein
VAFSKNKKKTFLSLCCIICIEKSERERGREREKENKINLVCSSKHCEMKMITGGKKIVIFVLKIHQICVVIFVNEECTR